MARHVAAAHGRDSHPNGHLSVGHPMMVARLPVAVVLSRTAGDDHHPLWEPPWGRAVSSHVGSHLDGEAPDVVRRCRMVEALRARSNEMCLASVRYCAQRPKTCRTSVRPGGFPQDRRVEVGRFRRRLVDPVQSWRHEQNSRPFRAGLIAAASQSSRMEVGRTA